MKIVLHEDGVFEVEGYKLPDNQTFVPQELAEAFVLAQPLELLDKIAKEKLESFANGISDRSEQVFSVWRENIPLKNFPPTSDNTVSRSQHREPLFIPRSDPSELLPRGDEEPINVENLSIKNEEGEAR